MDNSVSYHSSVNDVETLGSVVPRQLAEHISNALFKLKEALDGDVRRHNLPTDKRSKMLRTDTQNVPDLQQIVVL